MVGCYRYREDILQRAGFGEYENLLRVRGQDKLEGKMVDVYVPRGIERRNK